MKKLIILLAMGALMACSSDEIETENGKGPEINEDFFPDKCCSLTYTEEGLYLYVRAVKTGGDLAAHYYLDFSGTYDFGTQKWYDNIEPLRKKLDEQIEETGVILREVGGIPMLYDEVVGLSITSPTEVAGRQKGEELVDLFDVVRQPYSFSHPEGVLVEDSGEYKRIDLQEWMTCGYMCPSSLHLYPKEKISSEHFGGYVELIITVTLESGGVFTETSVPSVGLN
jgi:hypothetical protein